MLIFNDVVTALFDNKTKTRDLLEMKSRIMNLNAGGRTAFYNAIKTGIDRIGKSKENK